MYGNDIVTTRVTVVHDIVNLGVRRSDTDMQLLILEKKILNK